MTKKELILDQFDACYNEENWFIPLIQSLEGLTPEQAQWNDENNHSILQLVLHLIFWNERYLMRFKGTPLPPFSIGEEDPTFDINPLDWDSAVKKLNEVLSDFRNEIKNTSEEKLESKPIKESNDDWYKIISNMNIHLAYHTGQIIFVRKLQGIV